MRVYLEVYGCTANKADARIIMGLLRNHGDVLVDDINAADVIIILTCTVIDTTEQRMLSRLREFKKTGKPLVVAGCMASVQPYLIYSIVPSARLLPPRETHKILEILYGEDSDIEKYEAPKLFEGVIAPISIAEGCMFSCSYCITSKARGYLESYPVDCILRDIETAVESGCKEIQLTSQDTASYGLDRGETLLDLINAIRNISGDFRIRIGMMNPVNVKKNLSSLLEIYRVDSRVYRFFHLPVQSGDNDILAGMHRGYIVEDFLSIVDSFRSIYPDLTLSTDIIVGFPGESEENFWNTKKLLETVKPDIVNITRFSARPGTVAKKLLGRIPTDIVKRRSRELTEIVSRISLERNKGFIGKVCKVLVTEKGKNGTVVGRCDNYKPVVINDGLSLGSFVSVKIIDAKSTYLVGMLI